MSEEVIIQGGVVRVTDANVVGASRFNRIKATNNHKNLSVHFTTDGVDAPGPREALLVAIISGIRLEWLRPKDDASRVEINFEAVSAEPRSAPKEAVGKIDVFHMTTVKRGNMTRLHLGMTNQSQSELHGAVLMSKGQVVQMIAALLALYPILHED